MPGPIRTRQSCDRCHAQKLKCPKQIGSTVCTRCMKAGALCFFSPPGGGAASRRDGNGNPAFPLGHSSNLPSSGGICGSEPGAAFDWSFLQPALGLTDASAYTALADIAGQTGPGCATAFPMPDPSCRLAEETKRSGSDPGPTPPNPKSHCTQQLTKIMLDLDTVWVTLPPNSDLHFPVDENLDNHTAAFAERYSQNKALETLFGATQRLIDIYPAAIPLSLALDSVVPRCETDNCVHFINTPPSLSALEAFVLSRNSPSTIDHSLANLLISCHVRLIDVLDRLLLLVFSCFKLHQGSPTMREPDFAVPELRVGSFTPPPASAAFVQAFLMKHLLGMLSGRVDQLAQAVEAKLRENPGKECQALALQCEILKERQDAKMEHIGAVGEELVRAGMLG